MLADLLRARYYRQEEIQRFVRDHVVAPGKPLGTPDLVQHWRSWLVNLGVAPNDPSIFPLPVKDIAAALMQTGRISDGHRQFLRAGDPVEAIRQVVGRMGDVTPAGANVLMSVPDDFDGRIQVLEVVLAHNTVRDTESAAWLVKLMRTASSSRVKEAVVVAGTQHLEKTTEGPLPAPFLVLVLEYWSELSENGPVAQVVLRDAGILLRPKAPVRSAPRPTPRQDDDWPVREERSRSAAFVPEAPQEDEPADEPQGSSWVMSALAATVVVIVLFLVVSTVLGRLG